MNTEVSIAIINASKEISLVLIQRGILFSLGRDSSENEDRIEEFPGIFKFIYGAIADSVNTKSESK